MPNPDAGRVTSLYVHVPFCAQKCVYCAFYSEASSGELVNRYTAALVRELELVHHDLRPQTVFFGGGTPSLMPPATVAAIIEAATGHWPPEADIEITLEANPSSVEAARFAGFAAAGVNRLSTLTGGT